MEYTVTYVTLVAGIVTVIWFIRDVRKQNSKVLKEQLGIQKTQLEVQNTQLEVQKTQLEVLNNHSEILARIEEGQRKGFAALEEGLVTIAKILENQIRFLERLGIKPI